jgi:membrane protein DedA with SNARE-associated domain
VEQFFSDVVMQSEGVAAYAVIFGVLVACGLGVPLPEDISLVTGGFLAYLEVANLFVMMAVGFVGILCGDSLIFLAGRRFGSKVGRASGFFARVVTPEKRQRVEQLFHRHGEKIVMVARFLPGVRAVTYFTAGSAQMKYSRFIVWDGIAALASAPLFVYLGYRFGDELERLIRAVRHGESAALVGILVVGIVLIVARQIKASRRRRGIGKGLPQCPSSAEEAPASADHKGADRSALGSPGEETPPLREKSLGSRTPV